MTKTEMDVRSVLGASSGDIRPLVLAIDVFAQLLFEQELEIDEIYLTKDIYPAVAQLLGKTASAVSKKIERLANRCWDAGNRDRFSQIAGKDIRMCPTTRDVLVIFSYFSHKDVPFFKAVSRDPSLMV